ncbi:MAG: cytochrome c peroxidase [Phycisphaerae bacterium]|nr:cytochrome c peroxidase [Phycisphaerae bacterium]
MFHFRGQIGGQVDASTDAPGGGAKRASAERRLHLLALPLALLGLGVGVLLVMFDPVMIARGGPSGSLARTHSQPLVEPMPLEVPFSPEEIAIVRSLGPLPALRQDPTNHVSLTPRAAWLGQTLFFEPRLSGSGKFSCASCHDPVRWFADSFPVAEAAGRGTRNTPTMLNAAHNRWFGWGGRSDSMWQQALQPIEASEEMAGDRVSVVRLLVSDAMLRAAYENVFGKIPPIQNTRRSGFSLPAAARPVPEYPQDPLHVAWMDMTESSRNTVNRVYANVGKALAAYAELLDDGGAAFDRFVRGLTEDGSASMSPLSASELRGLKLFIGSAGCIRCHSGPTFSDQEFHNIGVPPLGGGLPRDPGRYDGIARLKADIFNSSGMYSDGPESERGLITDALVNSPENWGRFKTPSLRGVARTPPYMHAGQFNTLEQVVMYYSTLEGAVQLDHHAETVLSPLDLSEDEIRDLVAFLASLHGVGPPEELMKKPTRQFGS